MDQLGIQRVSYFLSSEECALCTDILYKSPHWQFGSYSDGHTSLGDPMTPFWNMPLKKDPFFSETLKDRIEEHCGNGRSFELLDVYANGHTYGQNGSFHRDSDDPLCYTFLLYTTPNIISRQDAFEYDGFTEFLMENDGTVLSIPPIYNTAILFPGTLLHRGKAFNRYEYQLRTTIAWKLRLCDM